MNAPASAGAARRGVGLGHGGDHREQHERDADVDLAEHLEACEHAEPGGDQRGRARRGRQARDQRDRGGEADHQRRLAADHRGRDIGQRHRDPPAPERLVQRPQERAGEHDLEHGEEAQREPQRSRVHRCRDVQEAERAVGEHDLGAVVVAGAEDHVQPDDPGRIGPRDRDQAADRPGAERDQHGRHGRRRATSPHAAGWQRRAGTRRGLEVVVDTGRASLRARIAARRMRRAPS